METKLRHLWVAVAALFLTSPAYANDDEIVPFEVAEIFFELNNTDGDLGIHGMVDGDEWKKIVIKQPNGRHLMRIYAVSSLRQQGVTELFFESAEPTFDELDPETFFGRFPEGTYRVRGRSLEGDKLFSATEITHLIPAQPEPTVNGMPYVTDCDEGELPVFAAGEDVVLSWPAVTHSHPTLGRTNEPIEVVNYEVVVEIDDTPWNAHAVLPPDVTSYELPEEILALGDEIKFEVLVREASYNQTAVESCFEIEGGDDEE